jgi:flagellar biosynthesis/type III secretory pathway protein FliH
VKTVQAVQPIARQSKEFTRAQFRAVRSSDSVSIQEAEQQAREAAQKAKQITSQEVEQKMRVPLQTALANLETVLDELSAFRRELFKESEQEILGLIQKICEKVVGHELSVKPELIHDIIARAVSVLEREKFVKIILNPQDLQMFLRAKPELDQKFAGRAEIEVRSDPQVKIGGALVETATRQIDVSVEAMVGELLSKLREQTQEVKETGDEGDKI